MSLSISNKYIEDAKNNRKNLHRIPEPGREEYETRKYCIDYLKRFGYKITSCFGTGFYADLIINDGEFIAYRADMDALPAQDKTDDEATSIHKGLSHNCGHDTHMSTLMLFGALAATDFRDKLKKNIRLIFQPSEEMFRGGASGMIHEGCLKKVKLVYGLHNDPQIPVGSISISSGIMSSNGYQFKVTIKGKSAHGSTPQFALDALSEGVRIVNGTKNIIANCCDPNKMALLTVCEFKSGDAPNIIANECFLSGSIRSFEAGTQDRMLKEFKHLLDESVNRGFIIESDDSCYPAIINQEEPTMAVMDAARHNDITVIDSGPMNGSEDFSYFNREIPGAFFFLGSGNDVINNPLHSNPFYIDDNCLEVGAKIFLSLAMH
ncbi:amidohydrolase [Salmonella enterica subsp. enterica serovar Newport]|nr:amidohydrolase [Salmonella enterica subsp. enterica serovar Newport]